MCVFVPGRECILCEGSGHGIKKVCEEEYSFQREEMELNNSFK